MVPCSLNNKCLRYPLPTENRLKISNAFNVVHILWMAIFNFIFFCSWVKIARVQTTHTVTWLVCIDSGWQNKSYVYVRSMSFFFLRDRLHKGVTSMHTHLYPRLHTVYQSSVSLSICQSLNQPCLSDGYPLMNIYLPHAWFCHQDCLFE